MGWEPTQPTVLGETREHFCADWGCWSTATVLLRWNGWLPDRHLTNSMQMTLASNIPSGSVSWGCHTNYHQLGGVKQQRRIISLF